MQKFPKITWQKPESVCLFGPNSPVLQRIITLLVIQLSFLIQKLKSDGKIRHIQHQQTVLIKELHQQNRLIEVKYAYLFAGIIHIGIEQYLIFVDDVRVIGAMENQFIYEITKISWQRRGVSTHKTGDPTDQMMEAIQDLFEKGGYYFCFQYNLAKSKQSILQNHLQFVWNSHLMLQCKKFNISSQWQTTIIQGFVGILVFQFMYKPKITYILISRRSNKRAGTRFYTRGIDDQGNVANYVETQQLIYTGNDIVSHIQIRGSVPLFWEQRGIDGIQSKLMLGRSLEVSQKGFVDHLKNIKSTYNRCLIINLLNKNKQSEGYLTQQFEQIMNRSQNVIQDFVRYEYFNFHQICGSTHFERCNPLIQKIKPIIESFGYFHQRGSQILSRQEGVIRSNCLDCLDRTNFIQAKVAICLFEVVLRNLDFQFNLNLMQNMDSVDCLKMVKQFKILWADNGDMISIHYTGMASTHTDVTREGKRTFLGMIGHKLKSLGRFYKQFTDLNKQETINLLLGYTSVQGSFANRIQRQIRQHKNQYSISTPLSIMMITWNVDFCNCPRRFLNKISNIKDLPSVVVIGLQSVYQCNKIIESDDNVVEYIKNSWKKLLESELVTEFGYTLLSFKYSQGSGLFIFFKGNKDIHLWDFGGFSSSEINFSGILDKTSQGILMTKLKIQDTTFLFGNFNFQKGTDLLQYAANIHEDAFQHSQLGRQRQQRIDTIDYKILIGHVGNSIISSRQKIIDLIQKFKFLTSQNNKNQALRILTQLSSYDILSRSKDSNLYLQHYTEGPLNFLPTSSFSSTQVYSQEQIPSYSSRILVYSSGSSIVKQHFYHPLYDFNSRHLPIIGVYTFDIWRQDISKKRQLEANIHTK